MSANSAVLQQQSVKARRTKGRDLVRILPAAFLVVTLSAELWVRIESLNAGYNLERLRTEALRNDTLLRELKFEYATLSAPLRTIERAKKEMKMTATSPQQLRRLVVNGEK